MYFNKSLERVEEDEEPFSLKALAISKGRTTHISEVTPKLFEDGQEVKLKKVYKHILDTFNTKAKYKKYFSAWIIVGVSWNIAEGRWYYMIRHRYSVFVWVSEDQVEKVGTVQKQIVEGTPKEVPRVIRDRTSSWVREQQSLDPNDKGWEAGSCEERLRERLKRRKK
jgi:hypothetical protein